MEDFWESLRHDPRQPGNVSMRASDHDREVVRAVLAEAYSDGRLTRQEHDDRTDALYGTRTLGDLASLVTDLVPPTVHPPASRPLSHADLKTRVARTWRGNIEEALKVLIPTIICTAVWFTFDRRGFFWPILPLLVLGIRAARRKSGTEHDLLQPAGQEATRASPSATADPDHPGLS